MISGSKKMITKQKEYLLINELISNIKKKGFIKKEEEKTKKIIRK